jgi:N-acetylglucosaminyldiphosphoundecaprenol N-acetyl-beta-D-mannosaminyltransferase
VIPPERRFIFNTIAIDNISVSEASGRILDMIGKKEKGYIVTPNAAHFLYLRKDEEFRDAYRQASLVLPDGYSIVLASKILGHPIRDRCTGVELFYELCNAFKTGKYRIFLLGGLNGSEIRAGEKLRKTNSDLTIDTYSPAFGFENDQNETDLILNKVRSFGPDILFVFLGSPKSEKFMGKYFNNMNAITAISLGAALDYYSGEKKRAPLWLRNSGFEWLFRLLREPRRLWKRYITGNTYFIYLIFRQILHGRFSGS